MGPAWRRNYLRYRRFFLTFFTKYKDREDLKMFLEILLSLITISIFSLLALRPTLITIAELIKEIESKKETLAIMDDKIDKLTKAQTLYDQEIGKIRLLETSVPHTPSPQTFVRQIEGLAVKHLVGIVSMSTGETALLGTDKKEKEATIDGTTLGVSGEIIFNARTAANYQQLFNFLSEIDQLRRPLRLDSLSVTLSRTQEGTALVLFLDGRIPYLKESLNTLTP